MRKRLQDSLKIAKAKNLPKIAQKILIEGKNPKQIAADLNISHQAVYAAKSKLYKIIVEIDEISKYRASELDLTDQLKFSILQLIADPIRLKKARLYELTTLYGVLFDKSRLLQDRSTSNISIRAAINEEQSEIDALAAEIEALKAGLP